MTDNQGITPEHLRNLGNIPSSHTADSTDDKPTLADVVNGTPEGQAAVQRAIERSIEDQNDMARRAKADSAAERIE